MTTTKQTSHPGSSQSPKQTLPRPNPHTWDPPCNPSMPPFSHRVAPNTEHRPGAHPLEALADRPMWSVSVLSSADGVFETLRTRLREARRSCWSTPASFTLATRTYQIRPACLAHHLTKQPITQLTRQPTSPSHLPVKQDNPLNPDFPGLSNARHDAALDACLCCLTASLGLGRRVPPRARARGGGWPRTGELLEVAGLAWCYGRRGACVVEVVEV